MEGREAGVRKGGKKKKKIKRKKETYFELNDAGTGPRGSRRAPTRRGSVVGAEAGTGAGRAPRRSSLPAAAAAPAFSCLPAINGMMLRKRQSDPAGLSRDCSGGGGRGGGSGVASGMRVPPRRYG